MTLLQTCRRRRPKDHNWRQMRKYPGKYIAGMAHHSLPPDPTPPGCRISRAPSGSINGSLAPTARSKYVIRGPTAPANDPQLTRKETLNARVEYASDDDDGRTHHKINQYTILEEVGRGSYGAVHLATDQFGAEYVGELADRFHNQESRRLTVTRLSRSFPNRACVSEPSLKFYAEAPTAVPAGNPYEPAATVRS